MVVHCHNKGGLCHIVVNYKHMAMSWTTHMLFRWFIPWLVSLPGSSEAMMLRNVRACPWPATPKPLTCHTQTFDLPHPKPLTCHVQTPDLPRENPWPATPKPLTSHAQSPWPAARGRSHDMCFFYFVWFSVFSWKSYIFKFQCSIWCGFLWFQVVFLFFEMLFFEFSYI